VRAGIPNSLAKIVLRCLEKDETQRFRDYEDSCVLWLLTAQSHRARQPWAAIGGGVVRRPAPGGFGNLFFFLCFGSPFEILRITTQPSQEGSLPSDLGIGALLYYALQEGFWGATPAKRWSACVSRDWIGRLPGSAALWLGCLSVGSYPSPLLGLIRDLGRPVCLWLGQGHQPAVST